MNTSAYAPATPRSGITVLAGTGVSLLSMLFLVAAAAPVAMSMA